MLIVWKWCCHSLLPFWNLSEYSWPLSVQIRNFLFFKINIEPQLLYAEVEKKLKSAVPMRWNHNNRLLETVQKHKTDFENLFITIIRMVVTGTQKVCTLLVATWHSWGTWILIFSKQCFQLYCPRPTVCSRFNPRAVTMCTALRTMVTSSSFCSSLEKTLILSGKEFWRWNQVLTQSRETEWNHWRVKIRNQPTTECLQRWLMC